MISYCHLQCIVCDRGYVCVRGLGLKYSFFVYLPASTYIEASSSVFTHKRTTLHTVVNFSLKGGRCTCTPCTPPPCPRACFLPSCLLNIFFVYYVSSEHFVRFCQWKYMELSLPQTISLNDFSVHRIIGRGGFGEVYGCRKDDSGKM